MTGEESGASGGAEPGARGGRWLCAQCGDAESAVRAAEDRPNGHSWRRSG